MFKDLTETKKTELSTGRDWVSYPVPLFYEGNLNSSFVYQTPIY